MGIDLSLTAPAYCIIPDRWLPDRWGMLFMLNLKDGIGKRLDIERVAFIVNHLRVIAQRNHVTHVFIEDYAFAAPGRGRGERALAELCGVLKYTFYFDLDLTITPVHIASARKTLLGHVPTKKSSGIPVKDYVNEALGTMGAEFETMDEGDAFVVANHGRSTLGLPHVGVDYERKSPRRIPEDHPRKRKRRALAGRRRRKGL